MVYPRLPLDSLGAVNRVLDHLVPPDTAVSSVTLVSCEANHMLMDYLGLLLLMVWGVM